MKNFFVDFVDDKNEIIISYEWYGYKKIVMEWISKMISWYEIKNKTILYPVIKDCK